MSDKLQQLCADLRLTALWVTPNGKTPKERPRADRHRMLEEAAAEIERLGADAARLRRLGFLIETGDWGIQYGDDDTWVDDGAELAKLLDSPEWIEEAEINERVLLGQATPPEPSNG